MRRWHFVLLALTLLAAFYLFLPGFGVDDDASGADVDELLSLPYAAWSPVESGENMGSVVYDRERAYAGLNLFNCDSFPAAYLIDMQGDIVLKWYNKSLSDQGWTHVELTDEGLYVLRLHRDILLLDRDSNLLWSLDGRFHHDLDVTADGGLVVIGRRLRNISTRYGRAPVVDDYFAFVSPQGEVVDEVSIYDLLGHRIPDERLNAAAKITRMYGYPGAADSDTVYDVFHTNSVEVIKEDVSGFAERGDLLFSVRELDVIAVLDTEYKRIRWVWGDELLDKQHHPSLLDNGNILLFDNGYGRKYSRILELDPVSEEIVWSYEGSPRDSFYSPRRGSVQRLPNGNTLIAESDSGRAFEVTESGDIVWEYYAPFLSEDGTRRQTIYRMSRTGSGS